MSEFTLTYGKKRLPDGQIVWDIAGHGLLYMAAPSLPIGVRRWIRMARERGASISAQSEAAADKEAGLVQ